MKSVEKTTGTEGVQQYGTTIKSKSRVAPGTF